jgi:hypothetical protein
VARRKRDPVEPPVGPVPHSEGTRVPEVREVDGARVLDTVPEDSPIWSVPDAEFRASLETPAPKDARGSIVRIVPPPGASDERIALIKARFEEVGAAVVRVMPRRSARVASSPVEKREHASARAVVVQLVAESNVEDRGALAEFVEGVMGRQAL